jgi:hypothetical protein
MLAAEESLVLPLMNQFMGYNESDTLFVGNSGGFRVDKKRSLTVRDQAPVFHGACREVRNGDKVALADGELKSNTWRKRGSSQG